MGSTETRPALERFLVTAVLALLVWAPLPLASNREWSSLGVAGGVGGGARAALGLAVAARTDAA